MFSLRNIGANRASLATCRLRIASIIAFPLFFLFSLFFLFYKTMKDDFSANLVLTTPKAPSKRNSSTLQLPHPIAFSPRKSSNIILALFCHSNYNALPTFVNNCIQSGKMMFACSISRNLKCPSSEIGTVM